MPTGHWTGVSGGCSRPTTWAHPPGQTQLLPPPGTLWLSQAGPAPHGAKLVSGRSGSSLLVPCSQHMLCARHWDRLCPHGSLSPSGPARTLLMAPAPRSLWLLSFPRTLFSCPGIAVHPHVVLGEVQWSKPEAPVRN